MSESNQIQYLDSVRSTIQGLDSLLTTILTQGTAFVLAILSVPFLGGQPDWFIAALVSVPAWFLSVCMLLAVWLYSTLLATAVEVGKWTEEGAAVRLTTRLDESHTLAGGRMGKYLYLSQAMILCVIALFASLYFWYRVNQGAPLWQWVAGFEVIPGFAVVLAVVFTNKRRQSRGR
jgi:hypothetical protein